MAPVVKVVIGDVFDSRANVLVVPCSTTGSMSAPFHRGLDGLGVTKPTGRRRAGEVLELSVTPGSHAIQTVLVAAVVQPPRIPDRPDPDELAATTERVESAARYAGKMLFSSGTGSVIAVPLLGTGAGLIEERRSAHALSRGFLESAPPDAQLWIYVRDQAQRERLAGYDTAADGAARLQLRPGADELLNFTLEIAVARGAPEASGLDVLLATLVRPDRTTLDRADLGNAATAELARSLPAPAQDRIAAALRAAGVDHLPTKPPPQAGRDDPRLAGIVAGAVALAVELGSSTVWNHHLAGSALTADPISADVLGALQVSLNELKSALLSGIKRRYPKESGAVWGRLLGPPLQNGEAPLLRDQPARSDQLDRAPIAAQMARLIRDLAATPDGSRAFAVHLDAPWGAGKSTLVNLLIDELRKPRQISKPEPAKGSSPGSDQWTVVRLDAWRSSQLSPAWWALLTHLQRGIKDSLTFWPRLGFDLRNIAQSMRRFWRLWVPAALVISVLVFLWRIHADVPHLMGIATGVGAFAAAAGGLAARFFSLGSVQGARLHERLSDNPMEEVVSQIAAAQGRSPRNVLLVLEDLDRCNEKFTVELLDAVQTLLRNPDGNRTSDGSARTTPWRAQLTRVRRAFRRDGSDLQPHDPPDPPTLVVLAVGDGRWLRAAYEHVYSVFSPYVQEHGRSLGHLFLAKLFEVHLRLPDPSAEQMSRFVGSMLGVKQAGRDQGTGLQEAKRRIHTAPDAPDTGGHSLDNELSEIMSATAHLAPEERRELAMLVVETRHADPHREERENHLLEAYLGIVERNPRAAKRFLMAYSSAWASRLMEPDPLPAETQALWALLSIRWPMLVEWIREVLPDGQVEPVGDKQHPSRLLADPQVRRVMEFASGGPLTGDLLLRCCGYPAQSNAPR